MIKYNRFVLGNGLRIIHQHDPNVSNVVLNTLYNVGARDEDPNRTGFAHLFEHLMFGGSENVPSFDAAIENAGGQNNAFTTNEITNYYISVPLENVETAFWLESDRMLALNINEKSLSVQQGVVVEEFKQRCYNAPFGQLWHHIRQLLYTESPYRWPTIGLDISHVEDATLERGIEIKPKKYLTTLSDGIQMIEDFYDDLSKQDYWKFSTRTGLHINIGTNKKDIEWNPIKGLLMMNDFNEGENTPYVFKDMTWRFNNNFCGSLIPAIKKMDRESIDKLKESIDLHDIKSAESILNKFLVDKLKEWGHKNFGFNLTKLDLNYVEFRYAGGEISKDVLIEKLKYFSFVVYTMTNPEYKKKEYLKKLYKFVDNL